MGILVRLFLSLGGIIVGAAAFAAAGGALFSLPVFAYIGIYGFIDTENNIIVAFCVVALGAVPSGIIGAIFGYKTGLKMGRDICFAPEPEQNSRVEVTVNGKSNKG